MYTDSDWATNKTDRKSITGFVLYFQGKPIIWRTQAQKTVALSSTEAEYYATSEATKEIKFILQVLESVKINVKKPIIVYLDNVGAIFVAETPSATKHTRHIDARYHFVRDYIIDGTIRVIFVSSKENKADILTKNVTSEIFEEHIEDFVIHRERIELTSKELNEYCYFDSGGVSEYEGMSTGEENKTEIKSHNSTQENTGKTSTSTSTEGNKYNSKNNKMEENSSNKYMYTRGIRMGEDGNNNGNFSNKKNYYGHKFYHGKEVSNNGYLYEKHKNKVNMNEKVISYLQKETYGNRGKSLPKKY